MANFKQTSEELDALQSLSLDEKIVKSKQRIFDWYTYFNGQVCISFSGGKDSTVLIHLVRSIFPEVLAVYSKTPDLPDVSKFAISQDNVKTIYPSKPFHQIIREYGYPVISKEVSEAIYYARRVGGGRCCKGLLTGTYLSNGTYAQRSEGGGRETIRRRSQLLGRYSANEKNFSASDTTRFEGGRTRQEPLQQGKMVSFVTYAL